MKGLRPVLDLEACTGCGACVRVCTPMVLELEGGRPVVARPDWCSACVQCSAVCPTLAITVPPFLPPEAPIPGPRPAVDPDTLLLLLRERRSVRRYQERPVPREILERLVEAGRYAPTGTNSQDVAWVVLADPEAVADLADGVFRFYERLFQLVRRAPGRLALRLLAGADAVGTLQDYLPAAEEAGRRRARGDDRLLHGARALVLVHGAEGDPSADFNGAVALYHASLLAHTLGVGCCFNGFVQHAVNRSAPLRRHLGIPDGRRCTGAMGLGFAAVRYRRLTARRDPEVRWVEGRR